MKLKYPLRVFFSALLSTLLLLASVVASAEEAADIPLPADVRVVIDVSGSMKLNDPENLRQPAVNLLLQLLPEGSKAGIWTFGQYVNMLVPHKPVTAAWKQDAIEKAREINSVGLRTNIGGALEKAAYDTDSPNKDFQTSVILLTDGMVDIDKDPQKNQDEWRRIVDEVLPQLRDAGYTIHTVALSDNADSALLDKLAIGTGGVSEVAHSADELMKLFLEVFDQAAPAEQVPLEGNHFLIDSSIEEFTALIFRNSNDKPTRLMSPDEVEYRADSVDSDLKWYRTDEYDLITVQRPLEGEWTVVADIDPDSRVTIVSDLNLLVKPLPSNLFSGDSSELSVLFQEKKKTVTDVQFLSLVSVDGLVTHDHSNQNWPQPLSENGPPKNGIFSSKLDMFAEEGRYHITVSVDGKSFQRQFKHQVMVRKPFVVSLEKESENGLETQRLIVRTYSETIDPENTQVVARVKSPDGRSSIQPLLLTPTEEWQLTLTPEIEGVYQIAVRISGDDREGFPIHFVPDPVSFSFPASDNPFMTTAEPEPVVVEEPAKEEELIAAPVEPKEKPQVDEEIVEPETAEESSSLPLYIGLGVGNVLLVVLAFFAYRMIMGSGKGDGIKDLEEAVEKADAEPEPEPEVISEPEVIPEPEPELMPEPEMVAIDEEDLIDPVVEPEIDIEEPIESIEVIEDELDSLEMDMGLDLSVDDVSNLEIAIGDEDTLADSEIDSLLAGLDEPLDEPEEIEEVVAKETADETAKEEESEKAEEDEDDGFSLDDFAPESLDELLGEETKKKPD